MLQRYFLAPLAALLLLAAAPRLTLAQTTPTGGVTIGAATAPDASAALDIVSSSKGLLLPRLANVTSITSPAAGLLVYQTGGTPGFYYNSGTAATPNWLRLSPGDNLGNHTATQDLNLNGQKLTGGGTNGLRVRPGGGVRIDTLAGTGQGRLLTVAPDGTLQASAPIQSQALASTTPAPQLVGSVATDSSPQSVAVNAAGTRAYVVNQTSNTLQVFDVSSSAPVLIGTVATGSSPRFVVLNRAGTRAYVTNQTDRTLQVFNVSSSVPVLLGAAPTGDTPTGVAVNAAGTRAYVLNTSSNTLQPYDVSNDVPAVLGSPATTALGPAFIVLNAAGTRAYVVTQGDFAFQSFDVSGSGTPVVLSSVIASTSRPFAVAINGMSTRVYVLSSPGSIQTYDITSNSVPVAFGNPVVTTGSGARGLAVNATGTRAYVTNLNTNVLQAYDLSSGVPVALGSPAATGPSSFTMTLNGAGTRAYILNGSGNNMLQVFSLGAAPTVVGIGSDGSLGTLTLPQLGDNLGNHTATQNLDLAGYQLVSGGSTGLALSSAGNVGIGTTGPTSTLQVAGSVAASIRTLSSGTIANTDYTVIVTGNVSLPAPGTANVGRMYHIINGNVNSNTVTGTLRDAGTSSSFGSITLTATTGSKGITVQSDGSQWWIIGRE